MGEISPEAWARARDPDLVAEKDGLRYPERDPRIPNPSSLGEVIVPADPGPDPGEPHEYCDCGCGVKVVLRRADGSVSLKREDEEYDCRKSEMRRKARGVDDGAG